MDQMRNDQQFTSKMLLIDEITFTRNGMFNMNNAHIWSIKNPYAIVLWNAQHRFDVNWVFSDKLAVSYLLPDCLNSPTYLGFLWNILPGMLSATQASAQQQMW